MSGRYRIEDGHIIGRAIGMVFKNRRLREGLSQEVIAKNMGVARATYSYIEQGYPPNTTSLESILTSRGISWEEFGREVDQYKRVLSENQ